MAHQFYDVRKLALNRHMSNWLIQIVEAIYLFMVICMTWHSTEAIIFLIGGVWLLP